MASKKDYINLIRYSCIIDSFTNSYFIRIIVLYLLSQNVTPWIAVSVPVVLDFARLLSRGIKPLANFALKVDYKKYHIFHLIVFLSLGLIISQCKSVYTIYIFTLISGFLSGIKYASITKLNTQNKEYEAYCFIEEERSQVIGATLGLFFSQLIYDISTRLYLLGYLILIVLGTGLSFNLKEVPKEDVMSSQEENIQLDKKSRNDIILVTTLFGILVGLWCLGLAGFTEIAPLISNKIGYLELIYTIIEIILLFIVSGTLLQKIRAKGRLLLSETIIACLDISCVLFTAITLSWKGLLLSFTITGVSSTLGDPIWGSIMSAYSTNNRTKYVLVNRVYFIIRAIFTIISWIICRECVIKGARSFRYLSVILIVLIIIFYIIANNVNKKVFKTTI